MESLKKKISEILSAEDELSQAKADVLRVLVIDGGTCWRTELASDLILLQSLGGGPEMVDEGLLSKALNELEKGGLIKIEKRLKSTFGASGVAKEEFLSLVSFSDTSGAMAGDKLLASCMAKRADEVRRALF